MLPNNNNNCNLHELVQFLCTYHQQLQKLHSSHHQPQQYSQRPTECHNNNNSSCRHSIGIEIRNRQMALGILLQPFNLIPAIYDRHSTFSSATGMHTKSLFATLQDTTHDQENSSAVQVKCASFVAQDMIV